MTFERRVELPVAVSEAFAWHERPGAFERLSPPFAPAHVVARQGNGVATGSVIELRIALGPLRTPFVAELTDCDPPHLFVDRQRRGPFAHWRHEHRFAALGPQRSELHDRVRFGLPLAPLTEPLAGGFADRELQRVFRYRQALLAADLADHRDAAARLAAHGRGPLRVLISGASGLVGTALTHFLRSGGHQVVRLVRRAARGADEVPWEPEVGNLDPHSVDGFDAAVHLAGAGIADGRWTAARKRAIRDSRVLGTGTLARALARAPRPPEVLISASAVGLYGDRGDTVLGDAVLGDAVLGDAATPGQGFLADVVRDWESAAEPARAAGIRVVHPRLGVVLSPAGGALAKLLPIFRLGLGGPLGRGRMWMPWVGLDDVLAALLRLLTDPSLSGPIHLTAPVPVRNSEFTRTLGRVLGRPALLPAPPVALRGLFGELADAALLASSRVLPERLPAAGFRFRHPELEPCLRHLLGR